MYKRPCRSPIQRYPIRVGRHRCLPRMQEVAKLPRMPRCWWGWCRGAADDVLHATNSGRAFRLPVKKTALLHHDVVKWKHFPHYWPFVRGIPRSPVNSPHKGQWRGVLMFSLICAWTNSWANNGDAGDLRRHCAPYDVTIVNSLAPGGCSNNLNRRCQVTQVTESVLY